MSERKLRSAVESYLDSRRDLVWTWTEAGSASKDERGRHVRPGWPDLTVVVRGGAAVLVELKRRDGRERPKQTETRLALTILGATSVVARSVSDVHRAVEGAMR